MDGNNDLWKVGNIRNEFAIENTLNSKTSTSTLSIEKVVFKKTKN